MNKNLGRVFERKIIKKFWRAGMIFLQSKVLKIKTSGILSTDAKYVKGT